MSTTLRSYQTDLIAQLYGAWDSGARSVMMQLHTGGGKTVILANVIKDFAGYSMATAHRNELVSQMSLTLAREGIRHDILAPRPAVRTIVTLHVFEFNRSYYQPGARVMVSGVDTLVRMSDPRFAQVGLYIADEGHHVLRDNKWGIAAAMFPNARGLFPTATPLRADGCGLGSHADGLADALIEGPPMRQLINEGYLTDYRPYAPSCDIDLSNVPLSAGGDYSPPKLREAVHKSHIVGDVVEHYLRIAPGKLGITFATDIESATDIAAGYRSASIPAEIISAKTPHLLRANIMRRFRNREILQLVNVDLLGEGVDIPAIEVVSFARPTQSYGLYAQQFGRALRPLPGKSHAIIIDHVGNIQRHGLPDALYRTWSLDRRERRSRGTPDDVIPMRTCANPACVAVYERVIKSCPYCGHTFIPAVRAAPEHVDGDLTELDPATLSILRGEVAKIDGIVRVPQHLDPIAKRAVANRHLERQQAQAGLRHAISVWAGYYRDQGAEDSEIYKRFYFMFGTDILSAQALGAREAEELTSKLENKLAAANVCAA